MSHLQNIALADVAAQRADALVRQPGFHKIAAMHVRPGDVIARTMRGDRAAIVREVHHGALAIWIYLDGRPRIRPRGTTLLWVHRPEQKEA